MPSPDQTPGRSRLLVGHRYSSGLNTLGPTFLYFLVFSRCQFLVADYHFAMPTRDR